MLTRKHQESAMILGSSHGFTSSDAIAFESIAELSFRIAVMSRSDGHQGVCD